MRNHAIGSRSAGFSESTTLAPTSGLGAPAGPRWPLRFDGRQGLIEAKMGGTTETYEAFFSVTARIGVRPLIVHAPPPAEEPPVVATKLVEPVRVETPPPPPTDRDGDGILDP